MDWRYIGLNVVLEFTNVCEIIKIWGNVTKTVLEYVKTEKESKQRWKKKNKPTAVKVE